MNDRTRPHRGPAGDPRRELGSRAESLCAAELEQRGWSIVDRNWRIRMGEIDIIAIDGADLVVVEVKAGHAGNVSGPARPALAVGRGKQRRLRMLAEAWLQGGSRRRRFRNVRFDVVGITIGTDGSVVSWQHIENAF